MPDPSALLRSMASAFEGVVKSVVRELDRSGELIPMNSLRNSTSFQPYCLLGRKSSSSWFWRPRYVCVNLSIRDILEPNIPEPGTPPGTESESQLGGEREGQVATCSGPLGCLFSEDRAFSKVPSLGPPRRGQQDGALPLALLQMSSVSATSTSKTPWTGSCRAVWSW